MHALLPQNIREAVSELCKLPGIGPKSAQRLVFYLLKRSEVQLKCLGEAIAQLHQGITLCQKCFMLSTSDLCTICQHSGRDESMICVVEQTLDVIAIEKIKEYHGLYHVLHGIISPIDGIGPDDLKIKELLSRIQASQSSVQEIILATNPSLEGETTALYLAKLLKPFNFKITRIALGMPVGGELEYADDLTLMHAMEGRKEYAC